MMSIKPDIIAYAVILAAGIAIGLGLPYVFGSGSDNRAWVLWEHAVTISPLHSSGNEEWRIVLAGGNKRECEKLLARLAADLKQRAKFTTEGDMNIELGRVVLDGPVLHHGSSTKFNGQTVLATMRKSLCFPETVDPRSAPPK